MNFKKALFITTSLIGCLTFFSCDVFEDVTECALCKGTIEDGDTQITGNPKVDAFFAATIDLRNASQRVDARMEGAVGDLAVSLGLERNATASEVGETLCQVFADASVPFNLDVQPAQCRADVDVAARASAECDVTVDPGNVDVKCSGSCEGTCRASCTGECRMPTVSAHCEGECHGACRVDVNAACYGTCYGDCSGSCTVTDNEGKCAGSCDGTCVGKCEAEVSAQCTGECNGECTVTADPGGCNGRCEGTCEGHCEGECVGTIEPPQVDADCEAQVEARVEANVQCDPPEIDFGVDTTAIENIAQISYQLSEIIAANSEAERIIDALETYLTTLQEGAEAVFDGELDAKQVICAVEQLDEAISALQTLQPTLQNIIEINAELISCQ